MTAQDRPHHGNQFPRSKAGGPFENDLGSDSAGVPQNASTLRGSKRKPGDDEDDDLFHEVRAAKVRRT